MQLARPAPKCGPSGSSEFKPLRKGLRTVHTPNMSLKNAALLALIGMILLTVLLAADFFNTVLGVVRDVVPAIALLRSLIYVLVSLSATVFFYVFHKTQS